MDIWTDFINAFRAALGPWAYPPLSALLILFLSLAISLISIFSLKKMTNFEELKEKMQIVYEFQDLVKQARKTMDPELLAEVQARQGEVMKIQGEVMMARMKPSLYFFIPFLIIFSIFREVFQTPVAYFPINLCMLPLINLLNLGIPTPYGIGFHFWAWYLIAGYGINLILQKITGTGMEMKD